ncbi:MAG: NAD(P)H-binding protein [Natronosporangium sp.]
MRIAVTGATGRVGGRVVALLAAADEHQVVALSRRPPGAARLRHRSPRVVEASADYADLPALRAALRDVDALVFVSSDGEATNVLHHHQCAIRAATDSGVTHIVALSGLDADLSSPFCYAVTYGHTEHLLAGSDCRVSIARASIYTEFLLGFLTRAGGGQLRLPAADGRISLVSRADVARCLAALAVAAPTGRHHDITGPESLDLAAVATLAEQVWRRPLRYVDVTPAEHIVELARDGLEPWWIRVRDDVRLDPGTALGVGLRRGPGAHRSGARDGPGRARPAPARLADRQRSGCYRSASSVSAAAEAIS